MSEAEKKVRDALLEAAPSLGGPILNASDRADLIDKLDASIGDPMLGTWIRETVPLFPTLLAEGGASAKGVQDALEEILGAGAARPIEEFSRFADATAVAITRLCELHGVDIASAAVDFPDPSAALADPTLPSDIARFILGGFRVQVLTLAIVEAERRKNKLAPWLGLAIAEELLNNIRPSIRLFASLPGADFPEEILPSAERLDLAALQAEVREASEAFHGLAEDVKKSGARFYPFATRPRS
jgi:hypothetical protein